MGAVAFGFQNCAPAGSLSSDAAPSLNTSATANGGGAGGQKTVYADVQPIFAGKCAGCHAASGTSFMSYATFMTNNYVVANLPNLSPLYGAVTSGSMPRGAPRLTTAEINLIQKWILDGALETVVAGPSPVPTAAPVINPTFSSLRANVFIPYCVSCHGSAAPAGGYDMTNYQSVIGRIFSVNPGASKLYISLAGAGTGAAAVAYTMPKGGPQLSADKLAAIKAWINLGAPNN